MPLTAVHCVCCRFAELIDTLLLLLRKAPVITLHWYHPREGLTHKSAITAPSVCALSTLNATHHCALCVLLLLQVPPRVGITLLLARVCGAHRHRFMVRGSLDANRVISLLLQHA